MARPRPRRRPALVDANAVALQISGTLSAAQRRDRRTTACWRLRQAPTKRNGVMLHCCEETRAVPTGCSSSVWLGHPRQQNDLERFTVDWFNGISPDLVHCEVELTVGTTEFRLFKIRRAIPVRLILGLMQIRRYPQSGLLGGTGLGRRLDVSPGLLGVHPFAPRMASTVTPDACRRSAPSNATSVLANALSPYFRWPMTLSGRMALRPPSFESRSICPSIRHRSPGLPSPVGMRSE